MMDPETAWIVSRAPVLLLGVGLGIVGTLAWLERRRERETLEVTTYRRTPRGLVPVQRRTVQEPETTACDPRLAELIRSAGGRP